MKIKKISNIDEKHILIGMITDDKVLSRIYTKWQSDLFKTKWANLVSKWCASYYKKYEKAPKKYIETLFYRWSQKSKDTNTIDIIQEFLNNLSDEYESEEKINSDYILDIAGTYFNKIKLETLSEDISDYLAGNDVEKAFAELNGFGKVEIGTTAGVDIIQDKEVIKASFMEKSEALIKYPNDLGVFFDSSLQRDCFVSFMGPDKSGKSFFLLDLAYRALLQNKKVAFFEAGDMSQPQITRRLMCRISKTPMKPRTVHVPLSFRYSPDGSVDVRSKKKVYNKGLSYEKAYKSCRKLINKKFKNGDSYFKLFCYPADTLSVNMIKNIIDEQAAQDWVPDVIVIDYADILDMTYPGIEGRDRINTTWLKLRSLAQMYHCLIVTATQSDAGAYDTNVLSRKNFSEDKRKMAHVTGMVGINVKDAEKKKGITRLNWILRREDEYIVSNCVLCAGNLSISNPAIINEMNLS